MPRLLTLAMFPVLVWMYARLARGEAREAAQEFGESWRRWRYAREPGSRGYASGRGGRRNARTEAGMRARGVCGMNADEKKAVRTAVHEGKTYYFAPPAARRPSRKRRQSTWLSGWPGFTLAFRYRSARYDIAVENPGRVCREVAVLEVDGVVLDDRTGIPLADDQRSHRVRVVLGAMGP